MNLIKCNNGHYYDADRFPTCPHCNDMDTVNPTVPVEDTQFGTTVMDTGNTYAGDIATTTTEPEVVNVPVIPVTEKIDAEPADIQKTVGFFEEDMGIEPVVGWLVCIEGKHIGKDFRLITGRNFIGRSQKMDVVLDGDSTVSRDSHAVVVYEPKGNVYLIQPGTGKELSYLNDQVVLESKVINACDVITVGATKLMFIPCCSERFNWSELNKDE